jgi:hypothetical protein
MSGERLDGDAIRADAIRAELVSRAQTTWKLVIIAISSCSRLWQCMT